MNEIQTLLAEFVEIVRAIGELIILFVPLPWRLSLLFLFGYLIVLFGWRLILQVIRLLAYITLWIVELIAGILLWPEYQITRQVRRLGGGPLWGTYLYGAIVSSPAWLFGLMAEGLSTWIGKRHWFSWFWLFIITLLPIGIWFARPYLRDTTAIFYVDQGFLWWQGVEFWIRTGEWRL